MSEWVRDNTIAAAILGAAAVLLVAIVAATWTLRGSMASLEVKIAQVEIKIVQVETQVAQIETKVDANAAAIARLELKVDANGAAIARNAAAIAELVGRYAEHVRQHIALTSVGREPPNS